MSLEDDKHVETVCLLSRKKQVANPLKISGE